ncbi:tRNA (adenosine(37)-N6)-threonylcarbamoyltransferase complex transferase subunit TsaD [Patescibacteria group bacterium]|nr:tRNA (adenosine(37)-N6)-threonylcarbamoyltransferase complex transferase subunit TsaD [Patescibacteria group bacterium]
MKILSIETSCDETAVSIVLANGGVESPSFEILGNALFSQIDIHKEFGGVYPMVAKREHAKKLTPLLEKVLLDSKMLKIEETDYPDKLWNDIEFILKKEEGLYLNFKNKFEKIKKPEIDFIAVTSGPGLAPALWVGISFALALGKLWEIPVIPTNHMEGHIASVLIENNDERKIIFPALALLISGGHTELVNINNWGEYKIVGSTRDDAVGEAFDKAARMLGLPYPGGVEISKLAEYARTKNLSKIAKLPRPMIHSGNLDFSFSGLKTAVLYYMRDNWKNENNEIISTDDEKADLAREFEDSVIEILLKKTEQAIVQYCIKTLIIGGGVIANKKIRENFGLLEAKYEGLLVKIPAKSLSTDNSMMIAAAAYLNAYLNPAILKGQQEIEAKGNLKLGILNLH